MSDYPRILYRDGTSRKVWGVNVDSRTVETAEEEKAARAEGWRGSPMPEAITEEDASALEPSSEAAGEIAELRTQLAEVNDRIADLTADLAAANELLAEAGTNNPLDHDGDGQSGGSLKGEESTAAVGARRKREKAEADG